MGLSVGSNQGIGGRAWIDGSGKANGLMTAGSIYLVGGWGFAMLACCACRAAPPDIYVQRHLYDNMAKLI